LEDGLVALLFLEAGLEVDDAAADLDAGAEFIDVEAFGDVIVGAGFEGGDDVDGFVAGGEEDDVVGVGGIFLAEAAAEFDAVEAGHYPIEYDELGGVFSLENFPSCFAVFGANYAMPPLEEQVGEQTSAVGIVIGDQDFHPNISEFVSV
jgi:hypothetical protein